MADVEYINKPKRAQDWEVGDTLDIFWTGFKSGEYSDEVHDRFLKLIQEAEEQGDEEKARELEEDHDSYFEDVHVADDGEIEVLLNGRYEISRKTTREDGSIIYNLVGDYGNTAQIRISPNDYDRELLVLYNSTKRAQEYIKEEYRQKSKNELLREAMDIVTKTKGKEIKGD